MRAAAALAALLALASAPAAQTVVGVVVEAETARPLPGANIRLEGTPRGAAADSVGRFEIASLAPGAYVVVASYVGFEPARQPVRVGPGERVEVRLALRTAAAGEVVVRAAPTATKSEAPVRLVPQAVAVVPERVLDARQATTLDEALAPAVGVVVSRREQPVPTLTLRGFPADATGSLRRNGVETPFYADPLRANVARVEVLKGPASVLYGRIEPGGVVNLVTKRPPATAQARAEATAGSYEWARLAVEAGGPLSPTWRARIDGSAQTAGSWRDVGASRSAFVAPAVEWRPSSRLVVRAEGEGEATEAPVDPGLVAPVEGGAVGLGDVRPFYGEPEADYAWTALFGTVVAEAALASGWTLRATASAGRYRHERGVIRLTSLTAEDSVGRSVRLDATRYRTVQGEALLQGAVRTGPLRHTLVVGAEVSRLAMAVVGRAPLRDEGGVLVFSEIAPVARLDPRPTGLPPASSLVTYASADGSGINAGVFVQDRVGLPGGRLHAVASARLSRVTAEAEWFALASTPDAPAGISSRAVAITALTPSLGLVAEPARGLALYASYGRSFNPVFLQVDERGEPFEPTSGAQVEAGAKAEGRGWTASVAAFHLEKRNALTLEPGGFYVQTGRQRSRGVEADVAGELRPGWAVLAGYALLDARVAADAVVPVGSVLPHAPRHRVTLWTAYRVPSGPARGAEVQGSVDAASRRYGSVANNVALPARLRVDVGASVPVGPVRLALLVRNVLDGRGPSDAALVPAADGATWARVWPEPPREVRLCVTVGR